MFKKSLISIAGMIGLSMLLTTNISAQEVPYDYEVESPFFHYTESDDFEGTAEPMTVEVTGAEADEEYTFAVEEITENGNFDRNITTFTETADSNGNLTVEYTFNEQNGEGYPYRLQDVERGETLMKGFVADTPHEEFRDSNDNRGSFDAVAFGNVVYNDDSFNNLMYDGDNPNQSVVQQGDYILLHYRLPIASQDDEHRINIASENTESELGYISSKDIYDFQGGDDTGERRSFLVLNTDGSIPAFIDDNTDTSFDDSTLNPFEANLSKGVYTAMLEDTVDDEEYLSENPLFVSDVEEEEWQLYADNSSVREGYFIRWNVIRETEEIWEVMEDDLFLDTPRQDNFVDQLEEYNDSTVIRYRVSDDIDVGEEGSVTWELAKSSTGDWYYGHSNAVFNVDITEDYEIREFRALEDNVNSFLSSIGLDDTAGEMFVVTLVTVTATILVIWLGGGFSTVAVVNAGLIALFSIIGFIPLWFIIVLVMIIIFGIMLRMKGGDD